jgi:hypothetical protein
MRESFVFGKFPGLQLLVLRFRAFDRKSVAIGNIDVGFGHHRIFDG